MSKTIQSEENSLQVPKSFQTEEQLKPEENTRNHSWGAVSGALRPYLYSLLLGKARESIFLFPKVPCTPRLALYAW